MDFTSTLKETSPSDLPVLVLYSVSLPLKIISPAVAEKQPEKNRKNNINRIVLSIF
jgi:hypothetical protein